MGWVDYLLLLRKYGGKLENASAGEKRMCRHNNPKDAPRALKMAIERYEEERKGNAKPLRKSVKVSSPSLEQIQCAPSEATIGHSKREEGEMTQVSTQGSNPLKTPFNAK